CVEKVASDPAIRGAVIGSAKSSFMAGADIKDMAGAFSRGLTAAEAAKFSGELNRLLRRMETCGKPFAAAINGVALGGGFEVALACHYRVMSEDPKAGVGFPEVTIGLLPGAGGTQRTPRLIGVTEALRLISEGKPLKAQDALKKGLVNEVAPTGELVERARQWILKGGEGVQPWDKKGFRVPGGAGMMSPAAAQTFMVGTALAAKTTMRNYPAVAAILSCVYEGTILPIDAALAVESKYFGTLLAGPVARNLMRTMFINKGLADKLARRPAGPAKSQVKKLGMLGAGMMGAGIAHVSAVAGMEVVLLDSTQELAEKGKDYSRQLLAKDVSRGKRTQADAEAVLARIKPTTSYDELAGCDLVIEAVFENRDIKADVTRKTEAVIPKGSVFASNTSTLPITGLAQASKRPAQFIGIHFFSPVEKMPLVEVILGKKTNDETLARALDYVAQIRKTPIVVNDSRGFYTSRCFGTFVNEGIAMLQEGVAPALIENCAKLVGMPVGPLAVADEVSIDLSWKIMRQTEQDLGRKFQKPVTYDTVRKFVEELKRPGKRFGAGFYDYPKDAKKHLWPGLTGVFPRAAVQPPVNDIEKRFLCIQALEAARCMEEGVVTTASEADLGSILGWGFPAWTGGTLSYIDTVGIREFVAECDRLAKRYGKRFKPSKWLRERAARGESFHGAVGATGADKAA
ncbi:MAG TPA: 3-hydroxyacyl-CoA dehydrogenase NAD-binding domain-containing protein, partial [Steroidobacteraceae bacterium]|nr:3-hydroxyacyl-CoA dehydrogenase NAD-binding domain-containing protein [Steroidobacteraceae bacterium]